MKLNIATNSPKKISHKSNRMGENSVKSHPVFEKLFTSIWSNIYENFDKKNSIFFSLWLSCKNRKSSGIIFFCLSLRGNILLKFMWFNDTDIPMTLCANRCMVPSLLSSMFLRHKIDQWNCQQNVWVNESECVIMDFVF